MLLKKKTKDFEELDERFKNKVQELIAEKHAHKLQIEENQRLEEEIKNLKQQITELNQQIEDLNSKVTELTQ